MAEKPIYVTPRRSILCVKCSSEYMDVIDTVIKKIDFERGIAFEADVMQCPECKSVRVI